MTFKYLILCTYIWIFASSGFNVACQEAYRSSPHFVDMSVSGHDLWSVHAVDDMGMCAKACNLAPSCLSYTYNWITGDCRGHSDVFDIYTGLFVQDFGSQYYYSTVSTPATTVSTGSNSSTTTTTKKSSGGGSGSKKSAEGGQETQETTAVITTTKSGGSEHTTQETTTA